ncbi:MAG: S8 family serine peptidase [Haloferacaceae archaeon]
MGDDATRKRVVAIVLSVTVLVGGIGVVVVSVDGGERLRESPSRSSTSVPGTGQIESLHEEGLTGDGVSVGVVVATGVDPDHGSLEAQVRVARAFGPSKTLRNGGDNRHGTATAAVVSRVAPDADLYLASFETAAGFEVAMHWLRTEGVDVVVAPVSFYGRPGDGSSRVARVADRAVANGTVVVAPVGNVGAGHWQGRFDPDRNGTHRFAGGPRNYLRGRGGGALTLWLSWERRPVRGNESPSDGRNFTVEVHRTVGRTDRLVARSRPYRGDDSPNAWLATRVDPDGTYYLVVRGPGDANGTRLEITSPTHALQYRERGGSVVAPATAQSVLAVGAADPETGEPRPYNAAGPVDRTRPGVDVVAADDQRVPGTDADFRGTSAASAYTAGVVALMLEANQGLSPKEVEAIVEVTAAESGPDGVDPVAGHGRLVPSAAAKRARNVST